MNLPILGPEAVFFVPAHLRIIFVCSNCLFVRGTLFDNLIYGVSTPGHADADFNRVHRICNRIGLHEAIPLLKDTNISDWMKKLSSAKSRLVSLARALIANPDVLCIDKPTAYLNEKGARTALETIREHVKSRGLESEEPWHFRRPRTCVYTSATVLGLEYADAVEHVSRAGVRSIDKNNVTVDALM
eukprot:TRINITY_DN109461_c0_g1_i1.p1 TRINITY_DN109461_c0_g1~~TRINITY_DN109461_c0_g1_i1.p1  ORF type:complete len:187 (-),score=19.40 TRINITY_DN109461_c0_g1_i1:67-627(-)